MPRHFLLLQSILKQDRLIFLEYSVVHGPNPGSLV